MKISVRGDKLEVTKAIKCYIEEKLERLDKYFDNSKNVNVKVLIKAKNNMQTIEVTIPLNKLIIRAEESNKDLYASIDLIIDKLERLIRKNKTKLSKHYKNVDNFEMNFNYEPLEEDDEVIVKRKNLDTKPMNEDEAILQMGLLNHDFFVFKNTDEECVSVIYKRNDGKYGIINVK